jgi:hypothetical protein
MELARLPELLGVIAQQADTVREITVAMAAVEQGLFELESHAADSVHRTAMVCFGSEVVVFNFVLNSSIILAGGRSYAGNTADATARSRVRPRAFAHTRYASDPDPAKVRRRTQGGWCVAAFVCLQIFAAKRKNWVGRREKSGVQRVVHRTNGAVPANWYGSFTRFVCL